MHINKLKVKPRKTPYVQPCALELTAMLGCWASSGDLVNAKDCREAAIRLHECMAKPQAKGKPRVSSVNYLLAKMSNK
ncbi:hypothetical protein DMC30DRAFT_419428 [Rhodotorula diobovata]|uniref:37S ribosomal protein mrp10, mitochondrial n=1 Tax=Rhodotorula diobovata TaxID=5288 RepID=A0A5C5FLQ6_9BASI|nr:hypothetical protein DMC30DRAFT_419428 [Rhodotorula diobovata]